MTLTPARLILVLLIIGASVFAYARVRSAGVEVDARDFQRRVLQARVPALVYFDVFYVNSVAHPEFARAYGVERDVVFVLFEHGRVVKRATAPAIQALAMAKNSGFYSQQRFLAEMEIFANLRREAG